MNLWQDIRYGERMLRKSPGFAITAVLTLALGIGATTAVFSVCDSLLWKPIALPHLESLVMVLQRVPDAPNQWNSATPADLDDVRRESTALENLATWQDGMANIVGAGGEPERAMQTLVSANFFTTFGVQPVLGRGFQEGEDQPGREREVVLSDRLWRRRFAADPAIVGKNIRLDDQNFLVTGVMPASFDFPMATELWTPHALTPAQRASIAAATSSRPPPACGRDAPWSRPPPNSMASARAWKSPTRIPTRAAASWHGRPVATWWTPRPSSTPSCCFAR